MLQLHHTLLLIIYRLIILVLFISEIAVLFKNTVISIWILFQPPSLIMTETEQYENIMNYLSASDQKMSLLFYTLLTRVGVAKLCGVHAPLHSNNGQILICVCFDETALLRTPYQPFPMEIKVSLNRTFKNKCWNIQLFWYKNYIDMHWRNLYQ